MTLQDLLGIELPIIQAPMAGVQGSALAVAVSNAGGLGSLPCAMLDAAALQRELAIQAQCVAQGADWRTLRVEQSALRADSVREKLQAALAAAGQACLLRVELGEVQDSWAKRQQAAQSAQQAEADAARAMCDLIRLVGQQGAAHLAAALPLARSVR